MSERMVAYCGLACEECPAFVAKRTGDEALQQATAKRWSGPEFPVAPEEVYCDGCSVTDGDLFKHCSICAVRSCAELRGVGTCAECPDYGCDKLEKLFSIVGVEARATLERLRDEAGRMPSA